MSRWREALDGKAALMRVLRNPQNWFMLSTNEREAASAANALGEVLQKSTPFYWTRELSREVARTGAALDHSTATMYRVMLPAPDGLAWFESPARISVSDEEDNNRIVQSMWVQAVMWSSYGRGDKIVDMYDGRPLDPMAGTTVTLFLRVNGLIVPYVAPNLVEGASLLSCLERNDNYGSGDSGGYTEEEIDNARRMTQYFAGRFMVASCQLLRERLRVEAPLLDRTTRRQMERQGFESGIRVIHWRKTEYEYPEDHESQPVDWSCHWTVKRHTRTYKRSGRTITIEPYVKGNLLAPYKPPAEVEINVVDR